MSLEIILKESWNFVLDRLGQPNLKEPQIISGQGTAYINMDSKEIFIYDSMISNSNLNLETLFRGVFGHEANHYVLCPYDLKTSRLLDLEAAKVSESHAHMLSNLFCDVVINLDLVNRGISEISLIYQDMNSKEVTFNTLAKVYNKISGLDFGPTSNYDASAFKDLMNVDYFDYSLKGLRNNCYLFSKALMKLNPPNDIKKDVCFDNGAVSVNEVLEELDPVEVETYKKIFGEGINLIDYYDTLSKKITPKIKNNVFALSKGDKIISWDVDVPIHKVDPIKSKGKYFPGLSLSRKETSFKRYNDPCLNDALILIDSSGSMDDPFLTKSQSVIAAYAIANSYLQKRKKVSTVNFSDETLYEKPSLDKKIIQKNLLTFQGGTTVLDLQILDFALKSSPDTYLISDIEIRDFDKLINFFSSRKSNTTIFHICAEDDYQTIRNVRYHKVSSASSISNKIINEVKRNGI